MYVHVGQHLTAIFGTARHCVCFAYLGLISLTIVCILENIMLIAIQLLWNAEGTLFRPIF